MRRARRDCQILLAVGFTGRAAEPCCSVRERFVFRIKEGKGRHIVNTPVGQFYRHYGPFFLQAQCDPATAGLIATKAMLSRDERHLGAPTVESLTVIQYVIEGIAKVLLGHRLHGQRSRNQDRARRVVEGRNPVVQFFLMA